MNGNSVSNGTTLPDHRGLRREQGDSESGGSDQSQMEAAVTKDEHDQDLMRMDGEGPAPRR